jgi:uncharacterized membrane protein YfcA
MLDAMHCALAAASGSIVGLTLGMFGGGGSILAVPLMVYLVGVPDAHVAIGTSALAVAASAATSLYAHARCGTVKWRCAGLYSAAGIAGALLGATLGKAFDGRKLLVLFAILMAVVGVLMFRSRSALGNPGAECTLPKVPKMFGYGALTGTLSGFFGIGGGFLIVPGLVASTGMPIVNAVGSSLVAVCAFGLTTATSYAASGLVDWPVAALFVLGGAAGGQVGCGIVRRMAASKGTLNTLFACLILLVSIYMLGKSLAQV